MAGTRQINSLGPFKFFAMSAALKRNQNELRKQAIFQLSENYASGQTWEATDIRETYNPNKCLEICQGNATSNGAPCQLISAILQ